MTALFRNRNFSLLWTAGLISLLGNWMLFAALPFHIYDVTGSALATSGWLIASILPGVLFGSVAGVFVDRWDRRRTMIVVNLLQVGVIPLLLLMRSPELIWVVYLVTFLSSTLSQFFGPAESALLPTLVDEEQLVSANSLNALNDNLARILGPVVGGVLLGVSGLGGVVLVDALTFLLAALLLLPLRVPPRTRRDEPQTAVEKGPRATFRAVWQEWAAGLKLVVNRPALRTIFAIIGAALFADAIISAVLVVFVQDDAGLNATQFGWLLTARGGGGLLGGLLIARLGAALSPRQLISGGLAASGGLLLLMLAFPILPVLLPLTGLMGVAVIAWIVALQTSLQQETEDAYRGRIFGAYGTSVALLMLVGSGIAGLAADWVGAAPLLLVAALLLLAVALMGWILLTRAEKPELAV